MELNTLRTKLTELLKKYRYMLLVVVIGIVLLLLPTGNTVSKDKMAVTGREQAAEPVETINEQLEKILSKIDGAGDVHVLLSEASGAETVYQIDCDPVSGEQNQVRIETVVVTGANREQTGLVKQVKGPVYRGAVVVCQGGGDPAVRLAVVNAISKLTGLGADNICVLKMK